LGVVVVGLSLFPLSVFGLQALRNRCDPMRKSPFKIIAGGQTGVDRAALDWAIAQGVRRGGWCPKGRRAEDGIIPRRYRLQETGSSAYHVRTRWNVRDSDGTLIISCKHQIVGGTKRTAEFARRLKKPLLHLTVTTGTRQAAQRLDRFIAQHRIRVLNIAGPRNSEEPGIQQFVQDLLQRSRLLARARQRR